MRVRLKASENICRLQYSPPVSTLSWTFRLAPAALHYTKSLNCRVERALQYTKSKKNTNCILQYDKEYQLLSLEQDEFLFKNKGDYSSPYVYYFLSSIFSRM
jgi:hypothetical protein